jgi:hypothetical protein
LIALGVVLGVAGAIMRYAVSATNDGFDFRQAGFILMLVGIGVVVLGVLLFALGAAGRGAARTGVRGRPRRLGRRRWAR